MSVHRLGDSYRLTVCNSIPVGGRLITLKSTISSPSYTSLEYHQTLSFIVKFTSIKGVPYHKSGQSEG